MAFVGGGIWALWRFVLNREAATKVDLDVDLSFVRKQGPNWIVEGVALVKNPGTVRLDFKAFTYALYYAVASDHIVKGASEKGTTEENTRAADALPPVFEGERSWLDAESHTFLEPGERSRYSFIAPLPVETTLVVLSCNFTGTKDEIESVKKGYAVPPSAPHSTAPAA